MPNAPLMGRSVTSRVIPAPPTAIYGAFTDPAALMTWQVPGNMTAQVHAFDLRVGGGYDMSLFYPEADGDDRGKSGQREDRYHARFDELSPARRIVETITFDTDDPAFTGEMTMTVTLALRPDGTEVTIAFEDLPSGISPADNDAGTRSSLEKLHHYVRGCQVSDDHGT